MRLKKSVSTNRRLDEKNATSFLSTTHTHATRVRQKKNEQTNQRVVLIKE